MAARKRRRPKRHATAAEKRRLKIAIRDIRTNAAKTLRSLGAIKKIVRMLDCDGDWEVERHVRKALGSVGALKKKVRMLDCDGDR